MTRAAAFLRLALAGALLAALLPATPAAATWDPLVCPTPAACVYVNGYDESRTLTCDYRYQSEIVGVSASSTTAAGGTNVGASYSCWNPGWLRENGAIAWFFVWPLGGNGFALAAWTYDSDPYGPYCGVYVGPMGGAPCAYVSVNADCASQTTPAVQICWRNQPSASVLGVSLCYTRNYQDYGKVVVLGNALESPWVGYAGCLVFDDVLG